MQEFVRMIAVLFIPSLCFLALFYIQAYMLKYDSTHGAFKGTVEVIDESTLEINGKQVKILRKR